MKNYLKLSLLTLFCIFTLTQNLFAVETNMIERSSVRSEILERVKEVVSLLDNNAKVDIIINFNDSQKINTSNPFILHYQQENDTNQIKSLKAVIYSNSDSKIFPRNIKSRIDNILNEYTSLATVDYQQIILPNASVWQDIKGLSFFEKFFMFFMSVSFFSLAMGAFYWKNSKSTSSKDDILKEGIASLKSSLDNISFSNSRFETPAYNREQPATFDVSHGHDSFLRDFSIDSIHEMLMDCYWSFEDEYASFIWSKLELVTKSNLLSRDFRLAEYANYLSTAVGVDKKYIHEIYYFNPLALSSISNTNLTHLVERHNSIFHLIPKLRLAGLGLNATEKKRLMSKKYSKTDTEFDITNIKWNDYITTEKRAFESSIVFKFESTEEEDIFFNDSNIDFSLASSFPSLGWLTFLSPKESEELFSKFSAKELAMAWFSSERILKKLETMIPHQKLALLNSYRDQLQPSRDSVIFKRIMKYTIELFELKNDHNTSVNHFKDVG